MSTVTAMMEDAQQRMLYIARARRYLFERDRLDCATEEAIQGLADHLRHMDFRNAIAPYLKAKERLIGDFFMLQTIPGAKLPAELERALAQWDEMIDIEARKFGFGLPQRNEHGTSTTD